MMNWMHWTTQAAPVQVVGKSLLLVGLLKNGVYATY